MSDLTNQILTAVVQASPEKKSQALAVLRGEVEPSDEGLATGPLLLGMGEGAKFLGVSRATLWRTIRAGRLAKVELFAGSYRVRREDLEALAAGKLGTSENRSRRGRPPRRRQGYGGQGKDGRASDPQFVELKALADAGDECAVADLFKEFDFDHGAGRFIEPRTVRTGRTDGTRLRQGYGGQAPGTYEEAGS